MSVLEQSRTDALRSLNRSNPCAGRLGAIYSYYMEREPLARVVGGLAWGIDTAPMYRSLSAIQTVPEDGIVLDVPCGAGLGLRQLSPEHSLTYLAVDLDPAMLGRGERRAWRDGLRQVEFLHADATTLPVPDASVDLCLTHGGLHCFTRPEGALVEFARCLRPSGRLVGTTFVGPGNLRQRLLFGVGGGRKSLPRLWTEQELRSKLAGAGFTNVRVSADSGYAHFEADGPKLGARSEQ